jgi:epoxide hydrolase
MDPKGRFARWTEFDRGGHFPALETPELLADDLAEFFGETRRA